VTVVSVQDSRCRRHGVSDSTRKPVVEGLAPASVPQLRAAADVAAGPVEARAAVTAGRLGRRGRRRTAVVDGVVLAAVAGGPRHAAAPVRRRRRDARAGVQTRRTVAVRMRELATVSRVTLQCSTIHRITTTTNQFYGNPAV